MYVDWPNKIINVLKADLTLIQSSPTYVYEMNLNTFRLTLKDLEDDVEGMPFLDTHRHNTEVTLGGLTFARVIEIINGYTVTFEDDQYAVNLIGANSNVADVTNVNQVSVRPYNSAGLISSPAIEYSSFNGGVTIDVINGTSEGTEFPKGTPQEPVKTLAQVKEIAAYRGFEKIYVIGDITFGPSDIIDGFIIEGQNPVKTTITLSSGLSSIGCEFKEATITGTLSGNSSIKDCTILDLTYVEGEIRDCVFKGTIVLAGNTATNILGCWDGIPGDGKPIIDMGGTGQSLTVGGYCGELVLANKTGPEKVSIDLISGEVELASSVTDGDIFVRGIGTLINNSSVIPDTSALIPQAVLDGSIDFQFTASDNGTTVEFGIWVEVNGTPIKDVTQIALQIFDTGGNIVVDLGTQTTDTSEGVFKFTTDSTNLDSATAYYLNILVTHNTNVYEANMGLSTA